MPAIRYSTATRTARLNAVVTAVGVSGMLKFYNGTQAGSPDSATTTTLLATLTFDSNVGTVTNGVMTFGNTSQTNANHVSGTPTWARVCKSDSTAVFDIPCDSTGITFSGTIATGVDITFNDSTSTITEGNP